MSKYQPRILINNPEKNVPDDIVEQFFLTIKSGNIDKIREFVMQNKNKYNLFDRSNRPGSQSSGKTPAHVVLDLDPKIADNSTKLRILRFLEQMGAPLDSPDAADVWPMHLAVTTQSNKIIDFLVSKQVNRNVSDSSGNTPLHYAITGREIACPKSSKPGPLVPPQTIDKMPLNKTLEEASAQITKILATNDKLNEDLIHIINTIMKIPEMYAGDRVESDLQTSVITIFTDVATTPTFPSGPSNLSPGAPAGPSATGRLTIQQNKLEQLIDATYSMINDEWRGLTNPIPIGPSKGGWGPNIPTGPTPADFRAPNNLERIMEDEVTNLRREINVEYETARNGLVSGTTILTNAIILNVIPRILTTIDSTYIDRLVFCTDCAGSDYGESVGLTKMLFLLIWNHQIINRYPQMLAIKIMENYKLMDRMFHQQIINRDPGIPRASNYGRNQSGYLFMNSMKNIIGDDAVFGPPIRTDFDEVFADSIPTPEFQGVAQGSALELMRSKENGCIARSLVSLFANSDDVRAKPVDLYRSELQTSTIDQLLNETRYKSYAPNVGRFRQFYRRRTNALSWFGVLEQLIRDIRPLPAAGKTDIFRILQWRWGVPRTPLPKSVGNRRIHQGNKYTYHELFRILQMLQTFLIRGEYDADLGAGVAPGSFPLIFNVNINDWLNYVRNLGSQIVQASGRTILQDYPEFIFIYNILVTRAMGDIYEIIVKCIKNNSKDILFDDSYILNLLLPSYPDPTVFDTFGADDPFYFQKSNKWQENSQLMEAFNEFIENKNNGISQNLLNTIGDILFNSADSMGYENMHKLRSLIEKNVPDILEDINNIIRRPVFRTAIRKYFGTFRDSNPKRPNTLKIPNHNLLLAYNNTTDFIDLIDTINPTIYDVNLASLTDGEITDLFFLTETYGHFFVIIKQHIHNIIKNLAVINSIVADIVTFIINTTYYYIPQIFLPALVKQVLITVNDLVTIRKEIVGFNLRKEDFMPLIDITSTGAIDLTKTGTPAASIIILGDEFVKYINGELATIYKNVIDALTYHNSVIKFLNLHSANTLIGSAIVNGPPKTATSFNFFDLNLIEIGSFPDLFTLEQFDSINRVLRLYRIPPIKYYPEGNEENRLRYQAFDPICLGGAGELCTFDSYREIIRYDRKGVQSDSPIAGENSQLNVRLIDNGIDADPTVAIAPIPNPIEGEWVVFSTKKTTEENIDKIRYFDAFIAYMNSQYQFQWTDGMPPSIRTLAGKHFRILKQQIIQDVTQTVINNYEYGSNAPITIDNLDGLKKMYDDIKNLGNESTYADLPNVKIYIVIAKLVDSILNELFKYVMKQSVTSWIYNFATRDSSFRGLTDVPPIIDIIRKKDYLKLSIGDLNKKVVDELLGVGSKYIDYQLPQVEPNPADLEYTTKPSNKNLIFYLYDINYFSQGDIKTNKQCYHIDPDIASKMILPDTINSKNADGNTPLHLAVSLNNAELVELLISRGANARGFTNLKGKTPYQIGIDNAKNHLQFSTTFAEGSKVIDTINNFSTTFNDLMTAQLLDDKYNKNIIKNVTDGIPIELVIYNHMFHVYLENYRYGFTIDLKDSIKSIINKYYLGSQGAGYTGTGDSKYYSDNNYIYPIDLFEIADQDLAQVLEPSTNANRAAASITKSNAKKIETQNKQIDLLQSQLNSLETERLRTNDSQQREFLDTLKLDIETKLQEARRKKDLLEVNVNPELDGTIRAMYVGTVRGLKARSVERTRSIIDFYNYAFSRVSNSTYVYQNIWNHYLRKQITAAPSMIFSILHGIISGIIGDSITGNMNSNIKQELATITNFFAIVKNYIELKESLPQNLEENDIYNQEFEHIKYLINLIITPAMRNILLGTIYKGLVELDGADSIIRDNNTILDEITTVEFNGQTIDSFLRDILPRTAFKYYTTIYSDNDDPEKKLTNANDLFLPIIQIVKNNRIIQVTDESLLVQNLREYLIPFMANTYNNFIHYVRLAIYGYERYLLNTYQILRILQSLI